MPEDFEGADMIAIGVAGALSKQYGDDQREFLPLLAKVLKDAMPNEVELLEVGFFKKSLKGLVVHCGGNDLKLEDSGRGALQATFTRVVRGIALKTETISVEEWLSMVSEALADAVKNNQHTRNALAQTLGLM